ncbi:MAG: DUF952 domain-containing protein [Pseudomonadota bacterium]|nr:DUF952 domain-containing protein [Pseudomonadota bacterium]
MDNQIFHICYASEWDKAIQRGAYLGSTQDKKDGFIHFSTKDQIFQTAILHYFGKAGLVLLTVDRSSLGKALKWEKSRKGKLFPHLYGPLPVAAVLSVDQIPLKKNGGHFFPSKLQLK